MTPVAATEDRDRRTDATPIRLPRSDVGPTWSVLRRLLLAGAIMLAAVAVTWLSRDGYRDVNEDGLSLLDCFYYATVSLSTTGYGDITPVTPEARFVNTFVITPLRVLFLIVLVGTTLEALTERSRAARQVERWRKHVRDHTVIIGFGTKGRSAARTLILNGTPTDAIVVVDPSADMIDEANRMGIAGIVGDATRTEVQQRAGVDRAAHIVVAAQRDDTAVLATLTARALNRHATLISSVREAENAALLQQSGATGVVVSSEAAGRLLGLASTSPAIGEVMQDLLVQGSGLDVGERVPTPAEVGRSIADLDDVVLGVVRGGQVLLPKPDIGPLRIDDRLVLVRVNGARETS
jgi:voltage-gated potassium channel